MSSWAIIRIGDWKFKIRGRERTGEPLVVAESLQADTSPEYLRLLESAANRDYEELTPFYIPYYALEIARILARDLKGEVLETCDIPRGPSEPGAVY